MEKAVVKILADDESLFPVYASDGAAGADLKAAEDGNLAPGEYKMIRTGLRMEIPQGYEGQIRPRSGLASKYGVTMLNSPGTIDWDYRGEISLIMINHGKSVFSFKKGERIGQIIFAKVVRCSFEAADSLSDTVRDKGGFGHTGR